MVANPRITHLISLLAFYSLIVLMIFCPLAFLTACLWLVTPLSKTDWFLGLYQFRVAFTVASFLALFIVLLVFHRLLVLKRNFSYQSKVHVGLTAYNDESCIGYAVQEFENCPQVDRVIVVENNFQDNTYQVALNSSTDRVVTEIIPEYGSCCMRALAESAIGLDADDIIILCEENMTFSANDSKKFLAYLENCDLVLGTRTIQELRATKTQMNWLINHANQIVAKMIQARFWGTRLSDVGCTYQAMQVGTYYRLKSHLRIRGNHFSPHMFIEALKMQMRVIEIPVVFRARIGEFKGVVSNKIKVARVSMRMLVLL